MKKLMYGGVVFASLIVLTIGCQKEVIATPSAASNGVTGVSQVPKGDLSGPKDKTKTLGYDTEIMAYWVDGQFLGCEGWGKGCGATTVVKPSKISSCNYFADTIRNGNSNSDIAVFSTFKTEILTWMTTADYNGVVDTLYTVEAQGSLTPTTEMYIILKDAAGNSKVYPFSE